MSKILILQMPLQNGGNDYDVSLWVTEDNYVVADVNLVNNQNHLSKPILKDLELCDLSGRKTRVPYKVMLAVLNRGSYARYNHELTQRFGRICLARLKWSIGCSVTL